MSFNDITINGTPLHASMRRVRDTKNKILRNLIKARPVGAAIKSRGLVLDPNRRADQIIDYVQRNRIEDPDEHPVEYKETIKDRYITIEVKFNDLTYRFDGVISGIEDAEKFEVLDINTGDSVPVSNIVINTPFINITNFRVEINK